MTRSLFPLAAALALLLAACAGNPPTNASDTADEGPTIYGQLGVSVDYVEID
jgi:ABC-type oligopeptide transport system substrate-binding subunit